jgi:D-alanyl-D-alanine carboxypeptidase (penicillin-binding protein 5/6)
MTIGFSSRVAMAGCGLCLTGALALAPAAAATHAGADPGAPGGSRMMAPRPALLYRAGTQVRPRPGAPVVPNVTARAWLVADADSGEVLAARDAHRRLPPASTLKTLFALTLLPSLPAGVQHRVTGSDLAGIGPGSSLVGVAEGGTYRVSDLWRGVFLSSGNDAVRVLAGLNGGWRATAARMQAKARALGAHDTRVVSPDGYDAPGQVSSAYDLAVFGRAGLRNPDFAHYCATVEAGFPGPGGTTFGIRNTNRLLTGSAGLPRYPGLIGVKNGYTSRAGHTLVAAARRGGRTLLVTVLDPRRAGGLAVYEEARSLLDWGFGATGFVDPVGSLDGLRSAPRPGPEPPPEPVPAVAAAAPEDEPVVATAAIAAAACLGAVAAAVLVRRFRKDRAAV